MNYLAIDTSGKALIIVACFDGKTRTFFDPECGVRHSVDLMPEIEKLLSETGADLKNADFIACVVGAGSFTGIRIGVSTAKALCFAFGKPALSITSFDTLAYNKKGRVMAVIDAGHGGYYVCCYDDFKVAVKPCFTDMAGIAELAKTYKPVSAAPIEGLDAEVVCPKSGLIKAAEMLYSNASADPETLVPLYIRKSQAEEGR